MSEGFWGKFREGLFPTPEVRCPHGFPGQKPIDCSQCQEIVIPNIEKKLSESERQEVLKIVEELKAVLQIDRIREVFIDAGYRDTDDWKFIEKSANRLSELGFYTYLVAGPLEGLSGKILGHSEESAVYQIDIYVQNARDELENGEEEIRAGQLDIDKYLEWRAKRDAQSEQK